MDRIYTDLLGHIAVFGGLDKTAIDLIVANAELVKKKSGHYFFRENDIAEDMYILISGEVEVIRFRDKVEYPITKLHKGECFGEMAIIDHAPRSANVVCRENCVALKIGISCFNQLYQNNIKQFTLLQMNLGREVCRRLRDANELLFDNEIDYQDTQFINLQSL